MRHKVWLGPVDTDGRPCRFLNHYECSECGTEWSDQWSCQCNDECPKCLSKNMLSLENRL